MNRLRTSYPRLCLAAMPFWLALWPVVSHAQGDLPGPEIAAKGTPSGAAACASCHGAKGEGNAAANFPRLAGLPATYIAAQLQNFAEGTRQNPVMAPQAKALSARERNAVAAYYASLPAAGGMPLNKPDATTKDVGQWLATRGRWDQDLPACVQCHGPAGAGVGTAFPPIAGQSAGYIASQLHAFKDGTRPGGPLNLMGVVAKRMSDADMAAVADYFAAAKPVAQSEAATSSAREKK
ncbi:c-type cytochrome [Noviherbaspirillum pedocola]|uniref:C-type cytochrome n=1 Tax=Noviherbaspirillum pedocola TaxID=2801341 RepID=A0A934SY12_9BURK|nr:c-type cytochrome [Noviherbaspirillum pedocola]MBK4734972.1 c-type cytochrome [Noviherbaspirillum pedocola]